MSIHADTNQGVCGGLVLTKVSVDSSPIISLENIKDYVRVDFDDDDFTLELMAETAIEYAENYCQLSLRPTHYVATYDRVASVFELPMGPNCIVSTCVDGNGNLVAFSLANTPFPKITITGIPMGQVIITYSAGYSAGTVPSSITSALLKMIATDYDIRANFEVVRGTLIEYSNDSKSLLKQHRRKPLF